MCLLVLEFVVRRDEVRVIFMGTPGFAVPCLEHLITNKYNLVAVYTQPDKPTGRGRLQTTSHVKDTALRWELPVVQPDSLRDEAPKRSKAPPRCFHFSTLF